MAAQTPIDPSAAQFNRNVGDNDVAARNAQLAANAQVQDIATNGSRLAQDQLQQATNQNIQNATGIIASAKGINPAMAAREAGYNAANANQTAANQAAQLKAQTQMAAQGQLSQNTLAQQQLAYGQNQAQNALVLGVQQGNTAAANGVLESGLSLGMGAAKGAGAALAGAAAKGGMVPEAKDYAVGGPIENPYAPVHSYFQTLNQNASIEPSSEAVKMMQMPEAPAKNLDDTKDDDKSNLVASGIGALANALKSKRTAEDDVQDDDANPLQAAFARGGRAKKKIPAMVSPGEIYLKPGQAKSVAKGKADPIKVGERIPGKPKVPGNSYANDVVPKKLESGGVVIPNSVMQSSDPAHNAYKFVQAVMARSKSKGKK